MTQKLRGVFPVFQTPFHADETLDLATLEAEVRWIIENGASGVTMGMVSEVLRLTEEERDAVLGAAVSAGGTHPVIASVGAESTYAALDRAERAESLGAAALMVTPPSLTPLDEAELDGYFRAILSRSSVPVIIQDASAYLGHPLPVPVQAAIQADFGVRVCFKPEADPVAPLLTALSEVTGGAARMFEGMGGAALRETYPIGIVGSMPGAEVCWAITALWDALEAGDERRAERIDTPLRAMIALQTTLDSFVTCEKHLLHRQGILPCPVARGPLSHRLDGATATQLDKLLEELQEAVAG